jgi:hypothetical protein
MRLASLIILIFTISSAFAHDIYTGIKGKDGFLCCGGNDCAATIYREKGNAFEFLTREGNWVTIPNDRITFLPIPGEKIDDAETHRAHLCYRLANPSDSLENVFGQIRLFCAFIPPGGV